LINAVYNCFPAYWSNHDEKGRKFFIRLIAGLKNPLHLQPLLSVVHWKAD